MIDATESSFETEVLAASFRQPVLVDFWAPWCGPCRALGPLLERLESAYEGKFRLVKVNSDQNPELSAQFKVRSIPYVIAFIDGQPVDAFVGALPESQLRSFIDKLIPNPSDIERRQGLQRKAAGDLAGALAAFRAALALNPGNDAARWDLAETLMQTAADALAEADDVLRGVSKAGQAERRHGLLTLQLESRRRVAELPSEAVLAERIARDPADLPARFDLAQRAIAAQRYTVALDQLLEIIGRDRAFRDDLARRTVLSVFDLMVDQPAEVAAYRRKLGALLNR